jgi:ApbE superfamily uncharacterized protein (UPF0280 family)
MSAANAAHRQTRLHHHGDGVQAAWLADGRRRHLQHGPIDLIISVDGSAEECRLAIGQAEARFAPILHELAAELASLRQPANGDSLAHSPVAQRMLHAVQNHAKNCFVTPMAAVAGAVADEVLAALLAGRHLQRAAINNGGDIALWLAAGEHFTIGLAPSPQHRALAAQMTLSAPDGIGGIASSGWDGRSHSRGIADTVTVLAASAASADVAATLIANAVDLPASPKVSRQPASTLSPDSDLGERLVTVGVDKLTAAECRTALERGRKRAEKMLESGQIIAAGLVLQSHVATVGRQLDPDAVDTPSKTLLGPKETP